VWSEFRFTISDTIETDDSDEDGGLNELLTAEQYYKDMLEPTMNDRDAIISPDERRKRNAEGIKNRQQKNRETKQHYCEPCGFAGGSEKELDKHYTSNKHKNIINNIN
tara:strand:+ start:176 stop:499 length:324 start_codon:yes stop_codon:yes gene_type:complete